MRRRPIGQILVEKGEISELDLQAALEEQERSGRRLGEILIEQGRTSWLALARAIAEQVLDIQNSSADPEPEPEPLPDPVKMVRESRSALPNLPPVHSPAASRAQARLRARARWRGCGTGREPRRACPRAATGDEAAALTPRVDSRPEPVMGADESCSIEALLKDVSGRSSSWSPLPRRCA